jgi:hypothetical protein
MRAAIVAGELEKVAMECEHTGWLIILRAYRSVWLITIP